MKNLILLMAILFIGQAVNSQDLIVTQNNDSLNCKITKIKPDYIFFSFMNNDEVKTSLLPMKDVKTYQKNFYYNTELPVQYLASTEFTQFRFAFSGGFSYLLAKFPDGIDNKTREYLKSFKKGFNLGISANYFFDKQYGVGLKYSFFKTSASADNLSFSDGQGNIVLLSLNEERTDFFIGPTFMMRLFSKVDKNAFIMAMSIGYFGYNDDMLIARIPLNFKGGTVGAFIDIGYDIALSDEFALGLMLSAALGSLNEVTVDDGFSTQKIDLNDQKESMSRIDISVVLSFGK